MKGKFVIYGVSVETVEEGLLSMQNKNVRALQVIFNLFRQKAVSELFPVAIERGVGILARVPLASGLLTGKFTNDHHFEDDDHRKFNRDGQQFNVGETFAGLPFEKGVELSRDVSWMADGRGNMTQSALKWILQHNAVSSVIPGFRNVKQVEDNVKAIEVKKFSQKEMNQLKEFYDNKVHEHIRGAY